jgi:hypothetical protein
VIADAATKRPSTMTWLGVHVFYPLLPFLLEGLIRLIVTNYKFSYGTFRSSTLSMSLGLLCLFVNQSLLTYERPLNDPTEQESLRGTAKFFLMLAIVSFSFYALLITLKALVERSSSPDLLRIMHSFESLVFVGCSVPVVSAIFAQRSFKLRASL